MLLRAVGGPRAVELPSTLVRLYQFLTVPSANGVYIHSFVMPAVFDSLVRSQGLSASVAWRVAFVVPFVMITAVAICILLLCEDTPDGPWSKRHLIVEGVPPTLLSGEASTIVGGRATPPATGSDKDVEKAPSDATEKQEPGAPGKARGEVTKTTRMRQITRITFSLQSLALVAPYACSFGRSN